VDLRTLLLFLACILMSAMLYLYGFRFLKKKNNCLGWEWLILASSAANFAFYWVTYSQASYDLMIFLDAFSRAFGIAPIAIIGMMAVTHQYKPSLRFDVSVYALGMLATAWMLSVDFMEPVLPYFLLIAYYVFAVYLIYFTRRLFAVGATAVAVHMSVAIAVTSVLHTMYDFYTIPGEETNIVFNFFFLALLAWTYLFSMIYYGYIALERSNALQVDSAVSLN